MQRPKLYIRRPENEPIFFVVNDITKIIEAVVTNNFGYDHIQSPTFFPENFINSEPKLELEDGTILKGIDNFNLHMHLHYLPEKHVLPAWESETKRLPLYTKC